MPTYSRQAVLALLWLASFQGTVAVLASGSPSVRHAPDAYSGPTPLPHPTRGQIARQLRVWWLDPGSLLKVPMTYLVSRGPYTVSDARGGSLTVVSGFACCGDGTGQGAFFWHNRSFIGMASRYVTDPVKAITSPRPGVIVVIFYGYAKSDPRCCPSRPPVRAAFRLERQATSRLG